MEHSLQKVEHDKVVSKARAWEESVKAKATNRCDTLHSGHSIMPLFWIFRIVIRGQNLHA
jgi:hypothetical protein